MKKLKKIDMHVHCIEERGIPKLSGLFYPTVHELRNIYDKNGILKGYSEKAPLGQRIYYDAKGNMTGTSSPGMLESTIYYDTSGRKTGISEKSPLGGTIYYEIK